MHASGFIQTLQPSMGLTLRGLRGPLGPVTQRTATGE